MRKFALTAYVLALAAFAAFGVAPYLSKKHDFASSITSPSPLASVSLVSVRPRERMCMSEIAVEQHARQARFRAGTFGKAGPALTVTMRGAYYGATEQIAAGWEDNALQMVAVPAPKRDDLLTVCIRNNGKVRIALYASSDRTLSRSHVTVNGHLQHASPTFGFWEGKPHTLGQRAGLTVERIAVFRGPFAHAWIVWTAFVLFGLALPLGFGWLLLRAVRED